MAAKKKTTSAPKAKDEAKKAVKAKESLAHFKEPHWTTREYVRRNTRGGKLSLDEKVFGIPRGTLNKTEEKAAKVMQARREGERTRTASRAKGIAKRQAKANKAARARRALGN